MDRVKARDVRRRFEKAGCACRMYQKHGPGGPAPWSPWRIGAAGRDGKPVVFEGYSEATRWLREVWLAPAPASS